jgi:hypothetical protein
LETDIIGTVAPDAAFARWLLQQSFALIETDGLNADAARGSEFSNGQRN